MRLVYLDESGLSRTRDEPYLVVAGVIIDADTQWKKIEQHFIKLTKKYMPDYVSTYGTPFIFHAMDIWHGSGDFPRSKWDRVQRMNLLSELCGIPSMFKLPVVAGYVDKTGRPTDARLRNLDVSTDVKMKWAYLEAFFKAARCIEYWMQMNSPHDVAMLIAEDTDRIKEIVGAVHASYIDKTMEKSVESFHSNYIVDAVHFTKKRQSIVMQIADHMAFVLKRRLMRCPHISPMYDKISPNLALRGADGRYMALRIPANHIRPME